MRKFFSRLFQDACEGGMKLPMAFDPVGGKPSVTLLFAYVMFTLTFMGCAVLLVQNPTIGTGASFIVWVTAMVFYLLRRLTRAKIDFDDRSIDLRDTSGDKE